ncbi:MAG TPA: hypothetical protein VLG76_00835 [Rhabdochlamydiaceae bacterium]|nr:hypothetical protein [Rhabdochlamydiaceae bacterium]
MATQAPLAIDSRIDLTVHQKLHTYYTVNLGKEKLNHDVYAVAWKFLAIASVVAILGASFFLFTLTIDAVIYIYPIAVFTSITYNKLNENYEAHSGASKFLAKIKETVSTINVENLRQVTGIDLATIANNNLTTHNIQMILARYITIQAGISEYLESARAIQSEFASADIKTKRQLISDFIILKENLKIWSKELNRIHYLISNPYEKMSPQDFNLIPQHHQAQQQTIDQLALTIS